MRQSKKIKVMFWGFFIGALSVYGQDDFEIMNWRAHYDSVGETALANRIFLIENKAGRDEPKRLRLDICERPELHSIQPGRLLVKCNQGTQTACLDISSKSDGFGDDESNKISAGNVKSFNFYPKGIQEEEKEKVRCLILKK